MGLVKPLFVALCLSLCACAKPPPDAPTLASLWTTTGFANPESVALAADGASFFVSNANGEADARDGNGFIARVGRDGAMLDPRWATGLDAPKGLALHDGRLYVADIDHIVAFDAASGARLAQYPVVGSIFLNDAAVAPDGGVLVSDTDTARIFMLKEGTVSVWLADDRLKGVNGLLPEPGRLMVAADGRLFAVDWTTKALTEIAKGLGAADGVAAAGDGAYLVSDWTGRLYYVAADGAKAVMLDTRKSKTLLNDFLLIGDTLIIPHWDPSTLEAYRVTR